MNLRPHTLKYLVTTGGGKDDDGISIPGKSDWVGEIPCRAVRNSDADEITFEDGITYEYSYVVYLDISAFDEVTLKANDRIQVWNNGRLIFDKLVHGNPVIKQLHVKVYI